MLKLNNDILSISVDSQGAYVNEFKYKGEDVFFPRRAIDYGDKVKSRGGSHVCLPQFGAPGKFKLDSHGYGRNVNWEVIEASQNLLKLEAEKVSGEYADLESILEFALDDNTLTISLKCTNKGEEELAVSPAFHHYYALKGVGDITLDKKLFDISQEVFADTVTIESPKELYIADLKLNFSYNNLPITALWTDLKADYFCVEPTYNTTSFARGQGYKVLNPEETAIFSQSIEVNPNDKL